MLKKISKIMYLLVFIVFMFFIEGCNTFTLKVEGEASGKTKEEAFDNVYLETLKNAQLVAADYANELFKKSILEAKLEVNDIKTLHKYSTMALVTALLNLEYVDESNMSKYVSISKQKGNIGGYIATIQYSVLKWDANEAIFNYIRNDMGLYFKLEKSKHFMKMEQKY